MAGLSGTLTLTVVSMLTSTTDGVNVRVGAIDEGAMPSRADRRYRHPNDRGAECERRDQRESRACAVSGPAGLLRQAVEHAEGEVPAFFGQGAHGGGSPAFAGYAARA